MGDAYRSRSGGPTSTSGGVDAVGACIPAVERNGRHARHGRAPQRMLRRRRLLLLINPPICTA